MRFVTTDQTSQGVTTELFLFLCNYMKCKKTASLKICNILMFRVILCVQFYRLTQLNFSTLLKRIIRKECQSFTNHGHAKTPPTVFNPLSLWLTLPRDMGVSHTQWPPGITRAILACLWFAQGSHKAQKNKTAEPFYNVQGDSMYSILLIDAPYFFNITIYVYPLVEFYGNFT